MRVLVLISIQMVQFEYGIVLTKKFEVVFTHATVSLWLEFDPSLPQWVTFGLELGPSTMAEKHTTALAGWLRKNYLLGY